MARIEFYAEDSITIEGTSNRKLLINCEVDAAEVVGQFDTKDLLDVVEVRDVVKHYDNDDLLDEIGKHKAMAWFDLVEKSDE